MQSKTREFEFTRRDFDFCKVSNSRTGIVVSDDKFDMFYSRLSRRVRLLGLKDFSEYCDLISNETEEREVLELVNALTTNLTAFFSGESPFRIPDPYTGAGISAAQPGSPGVYVSGQRAAPLEKSPTRSRLRCGNHCRRRVDGMGILATDIDWLCCWAADAIYPIERVAGVRQGRFATLVSAGVRVPEAAWSASNRR